MAFVTLGGDASTRPTYFEVFAADRLTPSLKAALIYSLSVVGQRRSWAQHLLAWEEEVFVGALLLLNRHSLLAQDALFSEALYGMKRCLVRDPSARVERWRLYLSLVVDTMVQYLLAKADALYVRHRNRSVVHLAMSLGAQGDHLVTSQGPLDRLRSGATGRALLRSFLKWYPLLRALVRAADFTYQLLYLMEAVPCHSPWLHCQGLALARMTGQELAARAKERDLHRHSQLLSIPNGTGPAAKLWGILRRGALKAGFTLQDHSSSALLLLVFGYKALEWWFTAGEEKLASSSALPPPPPPPAPLPVREGVGLPDNPQQCPLCRRLRVNPSVLAQSGYVFCYPCIFKFVMDHGCCPVTRIDASLDDIRKLYEAT